MKNYGLEKILSQVRRDEANKSARTKYDFELADNKVYISGDRNQIVIIENFQFPVFYGFPGSKGRIKKFDDDFGGFDMNNQEVRKKTVYHIKKMMHDLANDNFTRGDKFVTFVPPEQILDLKEANYNFLKFIQRLQYNENNGKPFKYLAGIEFKQENRECIHYHVLWNLPYIKQRKLLEYWGKGKGSVYINRIRSVKSLGDYLVKYIGKSIYDPRFEGNKSYLCSKNLVRKKGIYASNEEVRELKKEKKIVPEMLTYREKHETEFYGWKTTEEYNLERGI